MASAATVPSSSALASAPRVLVRYLQIGYSPLCFGFFSVRSIEPIAYTARYMLVVTGPAYAARYVLAVAGPSQRAWGLFPGYLTWSDLAK